MLSNLGKLLKPMAQSAPIKIHEIIFVWICVMLVWDYAVGSYGEGITNFIYMKWGGVALTMVFFSKRFIQRENLNFTQFMGAGFSVRALVELILVLVVSVFIGIGCWAALVFLSAKIDIDWAYRHWHFAKPSAFDNTNWLPSWLVLQAITIVVLGPIIEEIVFRGFILRRLCEKYRLSVAIIVSSLIFGIVHFDQGFLGSFVNGILYAIIAIRFASLYAPIFVHGGYNAITFFIERMYGVSLAAEKTQIDSIGYWLPELALLPFCMVALIWYWKMFFCTNIVVSSALVQRH
ncbi:CPBP family intramembrane metalloprotease [Massilia sp. DJPM01]|uniref:CPBP family intramembrane glutamic endopeptidase n=1 Tax=Massilia sp. DJPM01 TaxID=3024404 RepID=UPI00259E406A|nr:CPBP family intramembrane glutamic endopeptidase [Massilia sp. DJPM01]MDM5176505.1 CPBP family intramembrane metalloprotease [Massilia sp. DJPM01]